MILNKLKQQIQQLTPEQRHALEDLVREDKKRIQFRPLPGPQLEAYKSKATIIGYGGAAGGGKSALACGKALMQHKKVAIFRRLGTELSALLEQIEAFVGGHRNGYNGRDLIWRLPKGQQIEFCSVPHLGDERKYMGRPHDLIVFDEATNFIESQIRFLMTWLRTTDPNQRCQVLMTFNPPQSAEGRWIIPFFGPWLDPKHPKPAKPGELRWFASLSGKEVACPNGDVFEHEGEWITPQSRTFIPSRVVDNLFLMETNYMTQLQALPEPARSQMLHGDFTAGLKDSEWQVIPTAWVEAAMKRWQKLDKKPPMNSIGVDVARGGKDQTVIARRHGMWFDEPIVAPGKDTPDGQEVAKLVFGAIRDNAPIHIDVIGVGSSPYDFLKERVRRVVPVNVAYKSNARSASGHYEFTNLRSELWWKMREALDPNANTGIALPPNPELNADLCAPMWESKNGKVQVESREDIYKRIGRSPDVGTAYLLALMDSPYYGAKSIIPKPEDLYKYY